MKHFDAAIIGQGLAGTTLAWRLLDAGLDVVILDGREQTSASEVAAGLMTPITGKRFVPMSEWEADWDEAEKFYRSIESRTESTFFHPREMLRLFRSTAERDTFQTRRQHSNPVQQWTRQTSNESLKFRNFSGGFVMQGGQLDVREYLKQSRRIWTAAGRFIPSHVDLSQGLDFQKDSVQLPEMNITARWIFFCTGYVPALPDFLTPIRLNPAKGEILLLSQHELPLSQVIHRGIWIAPDSPQTIRIGATYEWQNLSPTPTAAGRDWLIDQLGEFYLPEANVVDHVAAVRPTMHDFHPVVGLHPHLPHVGVLNGLGSKGSLTAPRLSRLLVDHVLNSTPLPPEIALSRWYV